MTKSTSSAARAKPLTTSRLKSGKNNAEGEDSPLSSLSSMSSPSASPVKAKKVEKNSKDKKEEEKAQDKAGEDTQNDLQEGDSLLDGLLNFGPGESTNEVKNPIETAKSPFEPKQSEKQSAQSANLLQVSHSAPLASIHAEQDNLIAKPMDFETIDVLQNSPIAQQLDSTTYEPISSAQPTGFDNTIDPQQFLQSHAIDPAYETHQEEHIMVDDNSHQEFNPEQIILDIVESQERFTRSRSGRVIKQTNPNVAYNDDDDNDMDNDFAPSENDHDDHSVHSGDNKRQRKNEPIQYHPIEGFLNMKPRELGRGVQIGSLIKAITRAEESFNSENIQTHKSLLPYLAPTINVDHWTPIVIQLLQQDLEGVSDLNTHIKEIYSLMIQILKAGQANEPMPSIEHLSPQASQLFRHFLKSTDENIAHDPYILTHICRKLTISVMFKYNIPIRSFSTQANSLYSMYGDSNSNDANNEDNGAKNGNGGADDINAPMSINFMKQYNPFKLPAKILTMLSKK